MTGAGPTSRLALWRAAVIHRRSARASGRATGRYGHLVIRHGGESALAMCAGRRAARIGSGTRPEVALYTRHARVQTLFDHNETNETAEQPRAADAEAKCGLARIFPGIEPR